ncbi:MAG: hypothetical protein HQK54_10325 [Oligoflexales bacterium]|nr:hypothetical protein [Oligoflexales bacterium]
MYDSTREVFNKLKKKYEDYVILYKMLNNDSVEGITTFADFYIRMTYTIKYSEHEKNLSITG